MLIDFYLVHYNFGALAILIFVFALFLLFKKNYKFTIIFLVFFIAMNLIIHSKTANKQWTAEFYRTDEVENYPVWNKFDKEKRVITINDTNNITFATRSKDYPWVAYSETGDTMRHWCWFDAWWNKVSETDLVAMLWNEPANKKVRGSTEARVNEADSLK